MRAADRREAGGVDGVGEEGVIIGGVGEKEEETWGEEGGGGCVFVCEAVSGVGTRFRTDLIWSLFRSRLSAVSLASASTSATASSVSAGTPAAINEFSISVCVMPALPGWWAGPV